MKNVHFKAIETLCATSKCNHDRVVEWLTIYIPSTVCHLLSFCFDLYAINISFLKISSSKTWLFLTQKAIN